MRWNETLLGLSLSLSSAPVLANAGGYQVAISHATVHYYSVSGRTIPAIRASLDAHRPFDASDGQGVDAVTGWRMRWGWPGGEAAGCDIGAATVSFTAIVSLPRLATLAALPAPLKARWQRYAAALAAHEAVHVRDAYWQRGAVLAAIRGATCETANAAATRAVAAIVAHDHAYDVATGHGAEQGAHFP